MGKRDNRSAIWGGATIGLLLAFIFGLLGGNFAKIVLRYVLFGALVGLVAEILTLIGNKVRQ